MAIRDNRVNRESRGLLDLFRAKVGGQGPDKFSQEVRPIVDARAHLAVGNMRAATASTATSAGSISVTVPDDEAWLIWHVHGNAQGVVSGNFTAYGRLAFEGILNQAGTAAIEALLGYYHVYAPLTGAASDRVNDGVMWSPGQNFLLPPSAEVKNTLESSTGTLTIRVDAFYTPLKV